MALTTGLVQQMFIVPGSAFACVYIGPTPVNVEALVVAQQASDPPHTGAFKVSMLDALTQALASRHQVVVGHGDSDVHIHSVELR